MLTLLFHKPLKMKCLEIVTFEIWEVKLGWVICKALWLRRATLEAQAPTTTDRKSCCSFWKALGCYWASLQCSCRLLAPESQGDQEQLVASYASLSPLHRALCARQMSHSVLVLQPGKVVFTHVALSQRSQSYILKGIFHLLSCKLTFNGKQKPNPWEVCCMGPCMLFFFFLNIFLFRSFLLSPLSGKWAAFVLSTFYDCDLGVVIEYLWLL